MKALLFGTGGVPHSAPKCSSQAGIKQIRELGLDCLELAFVRRVAMSERTASEVRQAAEEYEVRLSVHAPYEEFVAFLELIEGELGQAGLEDMHIHISGIDYGPGGERKHLDLADADLRYIELLQALRDFEVGGLVICESPNLEEDAILLQMIYRGLAEH